MRKIEKRNFLNNNNKNNNKVNNLTYRDSLVQNGFLLV